jgi:hypothetical protein
MKLTLYVALLWAVWHLPDHFAEEGWGVEALISAPIIFAVEFVSLLFARASCCQRLCGSPRSPTDVLTALPFAGVHMPLLLLGDQVSVLLILKGVAGLLILGVVVRLLMGVMMRAALDSVLAVGVCIKSSTPATTTAPWSIRYWMAPMPAT